MALTTQLVDLAHAQDVEAGDGTTTVTILAGSLLNGCQVLLDKGIHPTTVAEGLQKAAATAVEVLRDISDPVCFELVQKCTGAIFQVFLVC